MRFFLGNTLELKVQVPAKSLEFGLTARHNHTLTAGVDRIATRPRAWNSEIETGNCNI